MSQAKSLDLFEQYDLAVRRMQKRFLAGEEQEKALIETVAKQVIVDKLVPARATLFKTVSPNGRELVLLYDGPVPQTVTIHRHALGQLCDKVGMPMKFVNTLEQKKQPEDLWKLDLLAHNMNVLFHKTEFPERSHGDVRFLHRVVDNQLRGFLSRRYNRYLASAPLLRAFVDVCQQHKARPVEGMSSPVRVSLKYMLPKVFEAFPGEHICIGVEWSNSDFGAGKMKVLQTVWRINTGAAAVVDEGLSRTHIGSVIEESDIEMSADTARKEVEAQKGAIVDTVNQSLSEKTVNRILVGVRAARDEKIPWSKLKGMLSFLAKSDVEFLQKTIDAKGEGIIDLPPISFEPDGTPVANTYWAASAVGQIASRTEDPDQRLALQREAGKLLAAALKG